MQIVSVHADCQYVCRLSVRMQVVSAHAGCEYVCRLSVRMHVGCQCICGLSGRMQFVSGPHPIHNMYVCVSLYKLMPVCMYVCM